MSLALATHAPLATIDLDGTGGNVLLIFYIIGGLAMIVASLLPGNSVVWKVIGPILGVVVVGWATYVLLFGGWIPISFYLLVLPILLVVRGVRAMVARRNMPAASPYGAQAGFAGRPGGYGQYGQGAGYGQPGRPGQYGAQQQDTFGQPQYGQQGQAGQYTAPQQQQPYVPPGTENWGQPPQAGQPGQYGQPGQPQQGGWGAPPQAPNSWN